MVKICCSSQWDIFSGLQCNFWDSFLHSLSFLSTFLKQVRLKCIQLSNIDIISPLSRSNITSFFCSWFSLYHSSPVCYSSAQGTRTTNCFCCTVSACEYSVPHDIGTTTLSFLRNSYTFSCMYSTPSCLNKLYDQKPPFAAPCFPLHLPSHPSL